MKRFRFPLTPVKAIRLQAKLRAREALARALGELARGEDERAFIHRRLASLEEALRAGRMAGVNAAQAAHTFAAYQHELVEEKACEARLADLRAQAGAARTAYADAHRNVEMIERLETKARLTYRLDCLREEQAEFDDLAGRRHARRAEAPAL